MRLRGWGREGFFVLCCPQGFFVFLGRLRASRVLARIIQDACRAAIQEDMRGGVEGVGEAACCFVVAVAASTLQCCRCWQLSCKIVAAPLFPVDCAWHKLCAKLPLQPPSLQPCLCVWPAVCTATQAIRWAFCPNCSPACAHTCASVFEREREKREGRGYMGGLDGMVGLAQACFVSAHRVCVLFAAKGCSA